MRAFLIGVMLLMGACTDKGLGSVDLQGAWTWDGADCAVRRYEITNEAIRAVLPNQNAVLYKILQADPGDEKPSEVVLDLQLLPQPGMRATTLQFLKDTGGVHSMALKIEGNRIRPLSLSMNGNSTQIGPGDPTYDEFALHRCPHDAVS